MEKRELCCCRCSFVAIIFWAVCSEQPGRYVVRSARTLREYCQSRDTISVSGVTPENEDREEEAVEIQPSVNCPVKKWFPLTVLFSPGRHIGIIFLILAKTSHMEISAFIILKETSALKITRKNKEKKVPLILGSKLSDSSTRRQANIKAQLWPMAK